jgi:outer membrane assembly lipoprotein YfiO
MRTDATETGRTRWTLALLLALACAGLAACGAKNPYAAGTFERGEFYHERGKHHEAVAALETFVRQNPTDSLAAQAQFLKAMSYMELKEYPLAAVELKILRQDFPTSPLVEDAYFQEGVAYFEQVGRLERDISGAYDARRHFLRFLQAYPNTRFRPQVEDILRDISDLVVRKKLNAARVYRARGRREAVLVVMDTILAEEADSRLLDRVLLERWRAARRVGDEEKAAESLRRLLADYPDSPFAEAARQEADRVPIDEDP